MTMQTVRGQHARVVENSNGKYSIELYANGKWVKPCCDKEFATLEEANAFFCQKRNAIHS